LGSLEPLLRLWDAEGYQLRIASRPAARRVAPPRLAPPRLAPQRNAPTFPPLLRRDGRKTIQPRRNATRRIAPPRRASLRSASRRSASQLNANPQRK